MERKKVSALASLSIILLASLALIAPIPPASANPGGTYRYWVMPIARKMPGNVVIRDSLADAPIEEGIWNFTVPPLSSCQNITFSNPWTYPGYGMIINLTVPAASYVGVSHMFYDSSINFWFRLYSSLSQNGYGWIFLNASEGDVDCHTFSNNTGTYWRSPSPLAGQLAALPGQLPSPGSDGVAGTADDGFGDGTNDPAGSSILMLPVTMTAEYHGGVGVGWQTLFTFSWPQVFTTENASAKVIEPASQIDGSFLTEKGQPWEFYAGVERPALKVPYDDPYWNAYVTYVCAWAMLDVPTTMGDYDNCFVITEKKVREDVLIADINCDEVCNIVDIVIAALAFDTENMNFGPDGVPYTADDKKVPDPEYDARGDLRPASGLVNIVDIVRIALDFDERLEP